MVFGEDFGSTAAGCAALSGVHANLFALHRGHEGQVGTSTMSEAGAASDTETVRDMHNHDSPC